MRSEEQVVFVGAGPGDPELITVKGLKALQAADLVIYAGSLVNKALLAELKPGAEAHDSAPLTLEQVIALMTEAVAAGRRVVRLHTGDPAVYGAIQEQMEALDALGIGYRVIPGVTAAFAAAASLKQELTLPEVSQTVVLTRVEGRTPVPEKERLQRIASLGATVALYLSVSMMDKVVAELLAGGVYTTRTPAAVVSKASWEDERIVEGTLGDIAEKIKEAGISRQALILVGEVLGAREKGVPEKSKLYDKEFFHGFRIKA
ncbi:precorrin-4 C(11)-methyltransferase [Desulfuromonas versatilis]|uniref:Precorrin-4 C(11)-methyltransferase n=1 Tax=Desulfuromonas versatilis TaxID=2802975 RepID=A0ABN6DX64_9BACT|nr:precorrin-4 C(11)-methyltransferase [Desulfuromonas versatilis]BCR03746.1 precorrin-4 C(11)-methyltransferase [Desulfuromonas versatilis]